MKEELIVPEAGGLSYSSYLKVDALLRLQEVLAKPEQHDEMLFIIIHQVYELWFKQLLHEADAACAEVRADLPLGCNKILRRMVAIANIMVNQVDVIETMTPIEFNTFRGLLNPASGFQSAQFRLLEFRLGVKGAHFIKFYKDATEHAATLEKALNEPTMYDEVLHFLARQGIKVPAEVLSRDVRQNHEPNEELAKALLEVYQHPEKHFAIYQLLESMLDLDEKLNLWRYRHVLMVERMIGSKMGTGGSSGVKYLSSTLSKRLFPEIWLVRNHLEIPKN